MQGSDCVCIVLIMPLSYAMKCNIIFKYFMLIFLSKVFCAPLAYETDAIKTNSTNGEPIHVKVSHIHGIRTFYTNHTNTNTFQCQANQNVTKFEWFYFWKNNSYTSISPRTNVQSDNLSNKSWPFISTIKLRFPSENITAVVCVTGDSVGRAFNGSFRLTVKQPIFPKIVTQPTMETLFYKPEMNLSCEAIGDPIQFIWLKNNETFHGNQAFNLITYPHSSTILLEPKVGERLILYTCMAQNFLGKDEVSFTVDTVKLEALQEVKLKHESNLVALIVGTCSLVFILVVTGISIYFQQKLKKEQRFSAEAIKKFYDGLSQEVVGENGIEIELEPWSTFENAPFDREREIKEKDLKIGEQLSAGEYGIVRRGYLIINSLEERTVAVKSILKRKRATKAELDFLFDDFLNEVKLVQALEKHPNVLEYIGTVTKDLPNHEAYLVLEYCCGGDIKTYLMELRSGRGTFHDDIQGKCDKLTRSESESEDEKISNHVSYSGIALLTSHLMKWGAEIASGLKYLADKRLVHRDIALRNILLACSNAQCHGNVDPSMLIAKVSDFGLSRDLNLQESPSDYYKQLVNPENPGFRKFPFAWMAPETFQTSKFTTKSDVWSFSVTLWELFTLGKPPSYSISNVAEPQTAFLEYLQAGNRLPRPVLAPDNIWEVIEECWKWEKSERPNFTALEQRLAEIYTYRECQPCDCCKAEENDPESLFNYMGIGEIDCCCPSEQVDSASVNGSDIADSVNDPDADSNSSLSTKNQSHNL